MDNPDEVFYVADRPYGLIEGTVLRRRRRARHRECGERWTLVQPQVLG